MKTFIEGNINFITKLILKMGSSNKDFLVTARKQKQEKFPKLMLQKYKVDDDEVMGHALYTMNADSNSHTHILYFHGGSLCLNGTIAHHLLLDKIIKETDVKTTYMVYPLMPQHKSNEIYHISYQMIKKVMEKFPDDHFILMGDSAGALVLLSAFQLLNDHEKKRIKHMILLSPWLDFSLSNPDMEPLEKYDFILSINQFKGLKAYDDIHKTNKIVSPMIFDYQKQIDIYVGTYDILYPDTCIFEERNKHVDLMIFEKHPHVFALLPMKKSKIVINHIIKTINDISYK